MANDINSVTIIGRLVRDPETRMVNQTSLANFSIASNRSYSSNGEKREEQLFIDCTAWGRLGDIVKQYCSKGKQVAITGRLKQNTWQDQQGNNRSKIEIVVESMQLLGGRNDQQHGGGNNQAAAAGGYQGGDNGFPY